MERPTSALHLTRVTLSLRELGAEPHTKEVGRDEVYNHHCLRSARSDDGRRGLAAGTSDAGTPHARVGYCHDSALRRARPAPGTDHLLLRSRPVWVRAQTWPIAALDQTHRAYLRAVEETVARLRAVEEDLRALLDLEPLRPRVQRLRCFRGIDDLTALTIAAELGDPRRFPTAPSTMAYVGLVPSEHSSGTKRARGAITKTGNAHLRRVLVEAAWHYRHKPFVGAAIRR